MTPRTHHSGGLFGLPVAAFLAVLAMTAVGLLAGWNRFVPILGQWESFHYFYAFGAVDPYLSLMIAPRANIAGQGYPMLDVAIGLTKHLGLSLQNLRIVTQVYGLAAYAALIVVCGRWFGLWPAMAGVTLALLCTGYLFLANQAIVAMPTLLLCVLLVERCQRLEQDPSAPGPKVAIAGLLALLLIHYGVGRFFALTWMIYFFAQRLVIGWMRLPAAARRSHLRALAGSGLLIAAMAAGILCLLDPRNLFALLDISAVFFPRHGVEIETVPMKVLPTIVGNLQLLAEMFIPYVSITGDGHPVALITGKRASLLNLWHMPFLIIGACVAVRRTFHSPRPGVMPYLALHMTLILGVGCALFSQYTPTTSSISPYRVVCGYISFAGYITVACAWIAQVTLARIPQRNLVLGAGFAVVLAIAVPALSGRASQLETAVDALVHVDPATRRFPEMPAALPYGMEPSTYLHAKYRKIAALLADAGTCHEGREAVIVQLDPRLLLDRGRYDGLVYIADYNDLSTFMALYLSDRDVNAGYMIVHGLRDRGWKERGHGYGGRPRVFSGPIEWQDGRLVYRAEAPLVGDLRESRPGLRPLVIVTFSDTETELARGAVRDLGIAGPPGLVAIDRLVTPEQARKEPSALCRGAAR